MSSNPNHDESIPAESRYDKQPETEDLEAFVKQTQEIVGFKKPGAKLSISGPAQIKARAIPNQRLIQVFGVNNAFTTKDVEYANEFRAQAVGKVQTLKDGNWAELASQLRSYTTMELSETESSFKLAQFIQFISLKISLKFLFNPNDDALGGPAAAADIALIASEINRLWIESKKSPPVVEWIHQTELHEALLRVTKGGSDIFKGSDGENVPLNPMDTKRNPLNWILPSYEAMWRIVLRCLLEVRFRAAPKTASKEWRNVLEIFAKTPTKKIFHEKSGNENISAHDVVKEALRLYPPSRSIYRHFDWEGQISKADLEECQRNANLAPKEPKKFMPSRWNDIEKMIPDEDRSKRGATRNHELKLGYMPFGCEPHLCPAGGTGGFGFRMIGLLVGTISEYLGNDWELENGNELLPLGESLNSGREDYSELQLKKKVQSERALVASVLEAVGNVCPFL